MRRRGRQGVWGTPYPWWNFNCLQGGEEPWTCWSWADYRYSFPWWPLFWEPEDNCGVTPDWCTWCGPPLCAGCPEGGWLPGQPDDGDPVDPGDPPACDEDREENLMALVLNAGGDPDLNGFADMNSNGAFQALIVCDIDARTTYNYQRLWAYEFRYDGGRERYLARRLNPANPDPTAQGGILDETWTDYDLDGSVYGDYQVAVGGSVTELQRYVPGLAQQSVATGAAEYFLGDQIGTTRFLTDDDQSPPVATTSRRVYTAFGELVEMTGAGQTRYGYAGAWGYQEHDADGANGPDNVLGSPPTGPAIGEVFPFLHVGWRYYDPSTGRFLQRDPIGIAGGINVYLYVEAEPVGIVDPGGYGPIYPTRIQPDQNKTWAPPPPDQQPGSPGYKIYPHGFEPKPPPAPPVPWWKRAAGAVGRGAAAVGRGAKGVGSAIGKGISAIGGGFFRATRCCPFMLWTPVHDAYMDSLLNMNRGIPICPPPQWGGGFDENGEWIPDELPPGCI